MLANRGMNNTHVAEGLRVDIDLDALLTRDLDLAFEDVIALAARFKKTWPYLLIDAAELRAKFGNDNRTIENRERPLSAALLDHLALVETMLEWVADLFPEVAYRVPSRPIGTDTPVSEAAASIRELLGVSHDEQLLTKDAYAALRLWGDALQGQGVYVQMRRLDDPTVRAFSVIAGEQAAVVADTHDVPYARVFSLLHEYVHIALRSAGICDLDDQIAVERFCNAVAAQVLMPNGLMTKALPRGARWGNAVERDEEHVAALSAKLGVSKAALLIRLNQLNVISDDTYEELEARRAKRSGKEESSGGNYHRNAINKVGRRFARRVVGAYEAGSIDRLDASTLLEIPEHNFPGLRSELAKSGE